MTTSPAALPWPDIDTVLLDMDGTLLDQNFDNQFFSHYLPGRYAAHHGVSEDAAREHLFGMFRTTQKSMAFYCLDHWSEITGLDIVQEKQALRHLIQFRADSEQFLRWLHRHGKRIVMVTNAHRGSFELKHTQVGIGWYFHRIISSHDYQEPKEALAFWQRLQQDEPHDPARSLLVDDNLDVLATAEAAGIGHLLCITTPSSTQPPRANLPWPAVDHFAEVLPGPAA